MTVITNPLKTEPRYQPGIMGAVASIGRLEAALDEAVLDRLDLQSILGDMAFCLGVTTVGPPEYCDDCDLRFMCRMLITFLDGRDELFATYYVRNAYSAVIS